MLNGMVAAAGIGMKGISPVKVEGSNVATLNPRVRYVRNQPPAQRCTHLQNHRSLLPSSTSLLDGDRPS